MKKLAIWMETEHIGWRGTAAADVMEIDGGKCQVDGQTGGRTNDATRQAIEPHFQERSGAAA